MIGAPNSPDMMFMGADAGLSNILAKMDPGTLLAVQWFEADPALKTS